MELEHRVALVTGGSSDIGRAISLALAQAGADIVVHYNSNAKAANACVAQIESLGRRGFVYQADVSKLSAITEMVSAIVSRFGRLDILVNGVGTAAPKKSLPNWTEQDWDFIIDATLKGTFFCSQRAAAVMISQKWGRIINISTTSTKLAMSFRAPYIASKGGVDALTLALALELAPHGITVNAVAPPVVPVERNKDRWDFYQKQLVPFIPAGRLCRPEDIGMAVAMFASPSAEYITGQILCVDGGWTSWPAYPKE